MDSSFSGVVVSQEEFNLFHKIDRELYTILTITQLRDPKESMKALAIWLWLERVGFRNVVYKILSLPETLISDIANETLMCLDCINKEEVIPPFLVSNAIPLLQSHVDNGICLEFMYDNRKHLLRDVPILVQEVCMRAFTDIEQEAITRKNNLPLEIWPPRLRSEVVPYVPPKDRTLFVTFSKGCPVKEQDLKNFFTVTYGDCIEALYMHQHEPPLFARIVFHKLETIEAILSGTSGTSKVKFKINGKHVWVRKFVPKQIHRQAPPSVPEESSQSR